jgi:hypothetical protein
MISVNTWGILAGVLIFIGNSYYLIQVFRKKVKPSLSGMAVFTLSTLLGGASTISKAGVAAGIVPLVGAALNACILLVALRNRHHGGWHRIDNAWIGMCVASAILWYAYDEAFVALGTAVLIEIIGYIAVFQKMSRHHAQESVFAWGMAGVAYAIPVVAYGLQQELTVRFAVEHSFALFNAALCFTVCAVDTAQRLAMKEKR